MAEKQPPNRIRELRDVRGWSVRDLADKTGIDFSTLNRLERGTQPLDLPRMRRIARSLGTKVSELLVDEDVELRASERLRVVIAEFESFPHDEIPSLLTAARDVVRAARALAAQTSASAGLRGNSDAIAAIARLWNDFGEDEREQSVDVLKAFRRRA